MAEREQDLQYDSAEMELLTLENSLVEEPLKSLNSLHCSWSICRQTFILITKNRRSWYKESLVMIRFRDDIQQPDDT